MMAARRILALALAAALLSPSPALASAVAARALKIQSLGLPSIGVPALRFSGANSLQFNLTPSAGLALPSIKVPSVAIAAPTAPKKAATAIETLRRISPSKPGQKKKGAALRQRYFDGRRSRKQAGAASVRASVGEHAALERSEQGGRLRSSSYDDSVFTGLGEFAGKLGQAAEKLTSPQSTDEEKSAEVSALFSKIDRWCAGGCGGAAEILKNLSGSVSEREIRDVLGEETIGRAAASLKRRIDRTDPDDLRYRVSSLVNLGRTVFGVEEQALFTAISEKGGIEKGLAAVGGDAERLIGQVQALYRLKNLVDGTRDLDRLTKEDMRQVLADINDLGFFYIKVAQTLSNTADVFSPEGAEAQSVLQENVPPMPAADVLAVIRSEFGKEAHEVFEDFDADSPIASGSIAQIYRAKVKTWWGGRRTVIVKVQRPGLKETLDWNRKLNRVFLAMAQVTWNPRAARLLEFIKDQVYGLEDQFEGELDFIAEARRMRKFRILHGWTPGVSVPKAYGAYSTAKVLTMSDMPGRNVDRTIRELNKAEKADPQPWIRAARRGLFSRLLGVVLYQVIFLGHMHADLHPGNILATRRGRVGLIDWSQSFKTRGMVALPISALYHLALGHSRRFARTLAKMGDTGRVSRRQMEDAAAEIFARHEVKTRSLRGMRRAWAHDDEDILSEEHFSRSGRAAAELIRKAQTDFDFRMSPRYTQLLRSAIPVLGTLTALLIKMPRADIGRVAAWKTLLYGPLALGIAAAHGLARLPFIAGRWIIDFNRRPVRASDEPKPRLLSWARVKYTWKNFLDNALQQPGSAKTIARGVALGVLIGMTPTVGIQWLVILLIAKPLRASMAAAMSVIWISNPLTMAPIYWLDYVVGRFFRPGAPATEGAVAFLREASSEGIWEGLSALWTVGLPVFTTALAGGLILGAALAVPLYFLVLRAAKAYRGANRQANP